MTNTLKEKQLEILIEIIRICNINNIRYYLVYGSCLGAVRHQGFIPWDDDVDISMPYTDLLKFEEACKTQLNKQLFFLQSTKTDPEYGMSIYRMRMNNTTLLEKEYSERNIHHGIFVDIYPLYGSAPTVLSRKKQVVSAMLYALFTLNDSVKNHGVLIKAGSTVLLSLFSNNAKQRLARVFFKKITKYSNNETDNLVSLHSNITEMKRIYPSDMFGEGKPYMFEGIQTICPSKTEEYLTYVYGDYLLLPPEEERKSHHNYIKIDFEKGVNKN